MVTSQAPRSRPCQVKLLMRLSARRNVSAVRSSASWRLPTRKYTKRKTVSKYRSYSSPNAAPSPAWARSMSAQTSEAGSERSGRAAGGGADGGADGGVSSVPSGLCDWVGGGGPDLLMGTVSSSITPPGLPLVRPPGPVLPAPTCRDGDSLLCGRPRVRGTPPSPRNVVLSMSRSMLSPWVSASSALNTCWYELTLPHSRSDGATAGHDSDNMPVSAPRRALRPPRGEGCRVTSKRVSRPG